MAELRTESALSRDDLAPVLPVALALAGLVTASLWRSRRPVYSFRGRTVVITGARGLALAMAREFASEGARLWLIARDGQELAAAADELRGRGVRAWVLEADITDPHAPARIVEDVTRVAGQIDVLVNNAGVIGVAPFEHTTPEDFERSLATHFWAPLRLVRAALPHMRRHGEGRIVNISSIGGRIAVPHLSAYAAGKFALTGLSETLRAELLKHGVLVTTVTPGLMRTGSFVHAEVRGRHEAEAAWFEALSATPLTAMSARRAARQIVEACRRGRATCTPNWQARAAWVAYALAPDTFAAITATVDGALLPRPSRAAGAGQKRRDLDIETGWTKRLLPRSTRRQYHQP